MRLAHYGRRKKIRRDDKSHLANWVQADHDKSSRFICSGVAEDGTAPNGDLIAVGGPAKAGNLGKSGTELRIYQALANERGVTARAYLAEGTPQSAIDLAEKILGVGNVKIFKGVK